VRANTLQDGQADPRWRHAFEGSRQLCRTCLHVSISIRAATATWRSDDPPSASFDNPSVYCESWKRIFDHIWDRIAPTLGLEFGDARLAPPT
jgi:uncharacterized protein